MAYTVLKENEFVRYFSYTPFTAAGYMYFFGNHLMTKMDREIHCIMPLNDTVFSFSRNRFNAKYIINLPNELAPREAFQVTIEKTFSDFAFEYARDGFFTGFTAIFETKNNLLLEYKHQGLINGFYWADKNTRNGNYYIYSIGNPIKKIPFFRIMQAFDNTLVGIVDADVLQQLNDQIDVASNPQLSKLKKITETLRFDDNPVLFFYHTLDHKPDN